MNVDSWALGAILGMAAVTYLTRAGGLWLVSRSTPSGRVAAWLRQVPGAIIVALVAPTVLGSGRAELVAAAATLAVAVLSRSLLLAMLAGILTVWLLR